jgi:hypothetical protein
MLLRQLSKLSEDNPNDGFAVVRRWRSAVPRAVADTIRSNQLRSDRVMNYRLQNDCGPFKSDRFKSALAVVSRRLSKKTTRNKRLSFDRTLMGNRRNVRN